MKTEAAKCRSARRPRIAMMVAPARMRCRSGPGRRSSFVAREWGFPSGDATLGDSPVGGEGDVVGFLHVRYCTVFPFSRLRPFDNRSGEAILTGRWRLPLAHDRDPRPVRRDRSVRRGVLRRDPRLLKARDGRVPPVPGSPPTSRTGTEAELRVSRRGDRLPLPGPGPVRRPADASTRVVRMEERRHVRLSLFRTDGGIFWLTWILS